MRVLVTRAPVFRMQSGAGAGRTTGFSKYAGMVKQQSFSPQTASHIEVLSGGLQDKDARIKAARGKDVVFHVDTGLHL